MGPFNYYCPFGLVFQLIFCNQVDPRFTEKNKRKKTAKNRLLRFSDSRKGYEHRTFSGLIVTVPLQDYSDLLYSDLLYSDLLFFHVIYLSYRFIFIGSPQHVMLPVQHASVEQQASPHAFATCSSNPHPSQRRT